MCVHIMHMAELKLKTLYVCICMHMAELKLISFNPRPAGGGADSVPPLEYSR